MNKNNLEQDMEAGQLPNIHLENNNLNMILFNANALNPQVFSFAVDTKITDIEEMSSFKEKIDENIRLLLKEKENLEGYCAFWLSTWATDRNDYYSGERAMLKQIKKSMRNTSSICKKFAQRLTPNIKRQYDRFGKDYPNEYQRSRLFTSTYSYNVFGDECLESGYDPIVYKTYHSLKHFFELLAECLIRCADTITKETEIARNNTHCTYLFDKQTNSIRAEFKETLKYITGGTFEVKTNDNPLLKKVNGKIEPVKNPASLYHKCRPEHLYEYVGFIIYSNMLLANVSKEEHILFSGNDTIVAFARDVIMNFDNLSHQDKKKIDPEKIALLIKYFKMNKVKSGLKYFGTIYHGKFEVPRYSAVSGAYRILPDDISSYDFVKEMEKLKPSTGCECKQLQLEVV